MVEGERVVFRAAENDADGGDCEKSARTSRTVDNN
jgi:hypothetical protein